MCHKNEGSGHTISWLFAWIMDDQPNHFDHRVETVQRVTNVFDGQIIWNVQNEQRKGLLRATRNGHLQRHENRNQITHMNHL